MTTDNQSLKAFFHEYQPETFEPLTVTPVDITGIDGEQVYLTNGSYAGETNFTLGINQDGAIVLNYNEYAIAIPFVEMIRTIIEQLDNKQGVDHDR